MKYSEQLDDIITRSFVNELTSDENTFLLHWLQASEQNRQYYEELKQAWQLTGLRRSTPGNDIDQEWGRFQQAVQNEPGNKGRVLKMVLAAAIAASVLLMIGYNYHWFSSRPAVRPVVTTIPERAAPQHTVHYELNQSDQPRQLLLADGSEVWLEPGSALSWMEPFTDRRRDIKLTGKARFKVAKDTYMPFTVYSGEVATTALGTQFTVTAFAGAAEVTVRLYEGKVVVQPVAMYLAPGEELVYNNNKHTAIIRKFRAGGTGATETVKGTVDAPDLPVGEKGNWYMFNNRPLWQVFDQLKQMYGVEIIYTKEDLEKMYFIGRFSKADSIGNILKQIAALNGLKVAKADSKYIISK